jgi:hypothetical protein
MNMPTRAGNFTTVIMQSKKYYRLKGPLGLPP